MAHGLLCLSALRSTDRSDHEAKRAFIQMRCLIDPIAIHHYQGDIEMKRYQNALVGILCIAFLGMGTFAPVIAADLTKITGTVNDDGQLVEDSGQVYNIADDDNGAQVMELSGEKIEVEAMVEEEDGSRVIVINAFKLLE